MKSGKPNNNLKRNQRLRLGKRDRRVLQHLADHQHAWPEVLHRVHFKKLQLSAAKSTIKRLKNCQPPLIRALPLYDKRVYYQLTFAGTRAIGASHRLAETLGRTTIIRQYALQSFLYLDTGEQRRLLTKEQLATVFDPTEKRLPRAPFYLASTSSKDQRSGLVVIDYGSEPRRCGHRIVKRAVQLVAAPSILALAAAGRFEIRVLTMTATKRRALYERLNVSRRSGGKLQLTTATSRVEIRLLIHVIPGLLELIPESRDSFPCS